MQGLETKYNSILLYLSAVFKYLPFTWLLLTTFQFSNEIVFIFFLETIKLNSPALVD